MKTLIAFLCSFWFLAQAHAAILTELRPAGPNYGTYRWQCAATGFVTDGSIVGACMERHYGTCSGRGCVPKIDLLGIWSTTWDRTGTPTVDFDSALSAWPGCQGTKSVVEVNGAPYYLIAADSLGDELVENNCVSWLVTP